MLNGLAPLICGCVIYDGVFTYNISGRLIGENTTPLGGRSMHVQVVPSVPADTQFPKPVVTEPNGQFARDASTKFAWGYQTFLGIPLGSTKPRAAPPLEVVYIAVERAPGTWLQLELPLSPAQQPEPGVVLLGDVRISD